MTHGSTDVDTNIPNKMFAYVRVHALTYRLVEGFREVSSPVADSH